jgi:hypothetical protein
MTALLTRPRSPLRIHRKGMAEANTYGLPRGQSIRRALKVIFRAQRTQMLEVLEPKQKDFDPLPDDWPDFELGALPMSARMTPLITPLWDEGGSRLFARIGLDPDRWQVVSPHVEAKIRQSALNFCAATNATTGEQLQLALSRTREELIAGVVTTGESVKQLTNRVKSVFENAETWRARRIAQSEASRAVHAAAETAAEQSGLVAGWEWLLSSDACPLCQTVGRRAKFVRLGQPFAVVGNDPVYSEVKFPPLHPHCNCTTVEVLRSEVSGEESPEWSKTLIQPEAEAEDSPPTRASRSS